MPWPPSWAADDLGLGHHEEAGLVAADVRVLGDAGEEGDEVHLHRDLAGLVGVEVLGHVGVGVPGRRAAVVQVLVELEARHGIGPVDVALHVVLRLRVVVLHAEGVHRVRHAHRDALGAALGVERCAVDLLAVDHAALEELADLLELVPGRGRRQLAAVLGLELLLQLGLGEPVAAVGEGHRVAHRGQRPVVLRALGPGRVALDGGRHEVAHLDVVLVEELVELDVVALGRGRADPLAVADQQVAQLALGVELVEHALREVRPGHELVLHLDAGLRGEVLRELDQRIGRVPGGPAQRELLGLGLGGGGNKAEGREQGGAQHGRRGEALHSLISCFRWGRAK